MLLEMTQVSKRYAASPRPVLRDVSLVLAAGESLALTGESGSGKSTLLHLAAALDQPDSGRVAIAGRAIDRLSDKEAAALRRDTVALVFQQFNLVPTLSVADNLSLHARLAGRADADWLSHLAERLGIAQVLAQFPAELSGGQQQRVAIGRALAMRPSLLLADEPTGNLDAQSSARVMELLLGLVGEAGTGLLLVTHSPAIAADLDRRIHLDGGVVQ